MEDKVEQTEEKKEDIKAQGTLEPNKLEINFNTGEKTVKVSIPHIELDKFATAIYWFCKENHIDATLDIVDNATLTTSED